MRPLVRDPNRLVRTQTAELLGAIGDRKILSGLIICSEIVSHSFDGTAEAIGRLGGSRGRVILEERLKKEQSTNARVGLYHGLNLLGPETSFPS